MTRRKRLSIRVLAFEFRDIVHYSADREFNIGLCFMSGDLFNCQGSRVSSLCEAWGWVNDMMMASTRVKGANALNQECF